MDTEKDLRARIIAYGGDHKDVDGFVFGEGKEPALRDVSSTKFKIGLAYKVIEASADNHPFEDVVRFFVDHDFHPASHSSFGYEHLTALGLRRQGTPNVVMYFANVAELEKFLGTFSYCADTDFAISSIRKSVATIERMAEDYGLKLTPRTAATKHLDDLLKRVEPMTQAEFDTIHSRGHELKKTVLGTGEAPESVAELKKRIELLEEANRNANAIIGAQADEFDEILRRQDMSVEAKRERISEMAKAAREEIAKWPSWMPRTLGPIPTAPKFPPVDKEDARDETD